MSLTVRARPKAYHKQLQARHHRQSLHYHKPYLPYLPMLLIVGFGMLVNRGWADFSPINALGNPAYQQTRLDILTGNHSSNLYLGVLAVTFLAFVVLLLSHWYRFHRMLNRG